MTISKLAFPTIGLLISTGLSFISCYLTISFCEQVRLCAAGAHRPKFLTRNGLFFVMAMITGFVGKFTVHLLVYSTASATDNNGNNLPVHLRTPVILVALFISMITAWIGLYISSCDRMFAKSKKQIVEIFVEDSKKLSFKEIQSISPSKMLFILATKSWYHLFVAGVIQGSGAIILRCLFIYACSIKDSHFEWNIGIIVLAVLLSFLNNIIGFWIMFRLTSLYPDQEWLRFLSAIILSTGSLIIGAVVNEGITLKTQHSVLPYIATQEGLTESQIAGFNYGLVTSICFAFFLMIIGFCDLRSWLYQTANKVNKFEMLMVKLKNETTANSDIITAFLKKYDSLASDNNELHSSSHGFSSSNNRASPRVSQQKFFQLRGGCCTTSDAQIYAQSDPNDRNNSKPNSVTGSVANGITTQNNNAPNSPKTDGNSSGNNSGGNGVLFEVGGSSNLNRKSDNNLNNNRNNHPNESITSSVTNANMNNIASESNSSRYTLAYNSNQPQPNQPQTHQTHQTQQQNGREKEREKEKEFVRSLRLQSVFSDVDTIDNSVHYSNPPDIESGIVQQDKLSPTKEENNGSFQDLVVADLSNLTKSSTALLTGQPQSEDEIKKNHLANEIAEKCLFSTEV